jgi:sirohydrochlorin ferrochelatase
MKTVKRAAREADLPYPYRVFFGVGDSSRDVRELQRYVRELEGTGAHSIVVIPLQISANSSMSRQWKYLLGVDVQPGYISNPLFPVQKHATIRYMEPLNDSAVVVEILLDRAQEMSEQPSRESVVIVTHGTKDESDNKVWIQILQSLCNRIKERGGFKTVEGFTLRDDAPVSIRNRAMQSLRDRIRSIESSGARAIVVGLTLIPTGMEHRLGLELRGLSYAFNTKSLLPDSRISEWIRSQVP